MSSLKMRVPVWSWRGGSELLLVTFHEFLTYVYEKYVILKLLVCFMQYKFVVLRSNNWGS